MELNFQPRDTCNLCRCPTSACYCHKVTSFASIPRFVILIHPIEARKTIATGRMTHLFLRNSILIRGKSFADNSKVGRLIKNPRFYPLLLFPGGDSQKLDSVFDKERILPSQKVPLVFVLDGTWTLAKQMYNASPNLHQLPRVEITPKKKSRFFVRKQPKGLCLSTIEAVHEVIDCFPCPAHPSAEERPHNRLLEAFEWMVSRQQKFVPRRT